MLLLIEKYLTGLKEDNSNFSKTSVPSNGSKIRSLGVLECSLFRVFLNTKCEIQKFSSMEHRAQRSSRYTKAFYSSRKNMLIYLHEEE